MEDFITLPQCRKRQFLCALASACQEFVVALLYRGFAVRVLDKSCEGVVLCECAPFVCVCLCPLFSPTRKGGDGILEKSSEKEKLLLLCSVLRAGCLLAWPRSSAV